MQQYFAKNKSLELEDSDYHHIKNVMRFKKGDIIKVVYDNIVYDCVLTSVNKTIEFDIKNKNVNDKNIINVDVAFGLIKEQKQDFLIQKATELNVNKLIPIKMIRSVVKIESKKEEGKLLRWKKIAKDASEQSFRYNIPEITGVRKLIDLINYDYDLKLLCSLNKNTKNIKKVLQNNNKCVKILLVVGPEGGFDPKEEEQLIKNGFISVSLGDTVLRSETACISALSMINYEFGR